MIKRSISRILLLVVFYNSMGCYVSKSIKKEEYEKIKTGDRMIITMKNGNKHSIIVEKIDGSEIICKYSSRRSQEKKVRISIEDIKTIELRQNSPWESCLAFISFVALAYLMADYFASPWK